MENVDDCIERIVAWERQYGVEFALAQLPALELQSVLVSLNQHAAQEIARTYKEQVAEGRYPCQGIFWRSIYPICSGVYEQLYLEQKKTGESSAILDHQNDYKLYFFPLDPNIIPKGYKVGVSKTDIFQFEKELERNKRECKFWEQELEKKENSLENSLERPELKNLEEQIEKLERQKEQLEHEITKLEETAEDREERNKRLRQRTENRN